ncbi:ParB/RepB/Spo0J family partition protein [Thalassospiraceae bacterium LMO-SO8]|nr:ParB/RepB/Spo0J family partition protein [Alphaproteobacteria bacterium LMO-S08]WND77579.1 ParB/RepB/Spo0J family partition protein [Thalassospiraceae bacterium LMO-SO8]
MMAEKRRNLGRGLSALLGEDTSPAQAGGARQIAIEKLHPGRYQPRRTMGEAELQDLAQSIRELGVLQPILVREDPDRPGNYEIIAGERRWRAAQLAQLHEVPVLVKVLSNKETLEVALVENLQREDLSPLEEAVGLQRLMDEFGHTQEALAKAVGKSRSHVANMLRLLGLPDAVKAMVDKGDLSAGHARALLSAAAPEALARQVVDQGLSVRQTEQLVQRAATAKSSGTRRGPKEKDADTRALETDLSDLLGLRVAIAAKGREGSVTLYYKSLDQLDGLLQRLSGQAAGE